MTLELTQIVPQIEEAVINLRASSHEYAGRKQLALSILRSQDEHPDQLKAKLETARTTWLVAGLTGGLSRTYPLPPLPADWSATGIDGSNIDFDRHSALSCFLFNLGVARLRYGTSPEANLDSYARLYSSPDELVLKDPGGSNQEQRVPPALLAVKRSVEEFAAAARAAGETPPELPSVVLLDGTLIFWTLTDQAVQPFVTDLFLQKGILRHLDEFREACRGKQQVLASYVSYPGGTEVVNVLRVASCPFSPPDCTRYCEGPRAPKERPCAVVAGIQDRELLREVLNPGERSELFFSQSSVVNKHYGEHRVHFFYLNVGEEIGRVEIPKWIAADKALLDLTHTVVFDQCQRGMGYPVALQEAHEKAVVTVADRRAFWNMISQELEQNNLEKDTSQKAHSKRVRWL